MAKKEVYDNNSISMLKGADRVRKRPGVIFGSDDLEGCIHGFFEILSNSTDEARTGHGDRIEVERYLDGSMQVKTTAVVFQWTGMRRNSAIMRNLSTKNYIVAGNFWTITMIIH